MCTTLGVDSTAASKCIKCGKCEQHCPQEIEIRNMLELVTRKLETPAYKVAKRVSKIIGYYKHQ
jgi:predicted aldo/keto reductase-like oxidoreductase